MVEDNLLTRKANSLHIPKEVKLPILEVSPLTRLKDNSLHIPKEDKRLILRVVKRLILRVKHLILKQERPPHIHNSKDSLRTLQTEAYLAVNPVDRINMA